MSTAPTHPGRRPRATPDSGYPLGWSHGPGSGRPLRSWQTRAIGVLGPHRAAITGTPR